MADFFYNTGKRKIADHTISGHIDFLADTIQVLLVADTYTGNVDDDFVDDGSANDPASHEISVTNYTPGFSGSGRKTLASKAFTTNDTNDRVEFDAADVTWTALGTGATIGGAVVYKRGTADTDSQLIAFFDLTNTPTNGGDISVSWSSTGLFHF